MTKIPFGFGEKVVHLELKLSKNPNYIAFTGNIRNQTASKSIFMS